MKIIVVALSLLLLTGCSFFKPYQPTQHQGGVIEVSSSEQLKLGMNKTQVTYLIGLPILTDSIDQDTWQYIYTEKNKNEFEIKQKITLTFKDNVLVNITDNNEAT